MSTPSRVRSMVSSLSAVWADCNNASRRLVELQMRPQGVHGKNAR